MPPGPVGVGAHRVAVLRAWGGAPELLRREATTRRECSAAARVEAQHEKRWLHVVSRRALSELPRAATSESAILKLARLLVTGVLPNARQRKAPDDIFTLSQRYHSPKPHLDHGVLCCITAF